MGSPISFELQEYLSVLVLYQCPSMYIVVASTIGFILSHKKRNDNNQG